MTRLNSGNFVSFLGYVYIIILTPHDDRTVKNVQKMMNFFEYS